MSRFLRRFSFGSIAGFLPLDSFILSELFTYASPLLDLLDTINPQLPQL